MNSFTNRRHFLRGTGALIALPALESLGFRLFASATPKATDGIPKRAVFMGMGFGVTKETWYPDLKDTGAGYKLTEGLAPLARHKKDFTVLQGCSNQYSQRSPLGQHLLADRRQPLLRSRPEHGQ